MYRQLSRGAACAALALLVLQVAGVARQPVSPESLDNFDVRRDKSGTAAGYLERVTATQSKQLAPALAELRANGTERLHANYPSLELVTSSALGTLELVGTAPGKGFLTAPGLDRVATLKGFLSEHADAYGFSAEDAERLEVVADYLNPAGNMGWAELEQRINGLPVFQGTIRGGFTAKGELVRTTGILATGIDASILATSPSISAPHAIALAAANVGWQVDETLVFEKGVDAAGHAIFARASMADDAKAWLLYFPLAPGLVRLAWAIQIVGDPMAYLTLLDAQDGSILFRKNLTDFQTQPATYKIYNDDSPAPMSPSTTVPPMGTQAPVIARTTMTLIGNEAPNSFNALGWISDNTNVTDGNNVEAGVDLVAPNGVDAPTVGSPIRVFDFAYNPAPGNPAPGDAPTGAAFRNGEVTNMFYWANVYHDRVYQLGFTEPAHNFQDDNFSRGGVAADRISAEAQDSSGTNNANFSSGVDGTRGRLQMFLWTGPTPDHSGGLDQDVILHELTHGLSQRLHNNGAGLALNMSRGMGEGWSDFYARSLLASADENVSGIYTLGGYATHLLLAGFTDNYYYGIRRFPYAVKTSVGGPMNRPHNPLTFADIDFTQIDLTDGAFPRSPFVSSTIADQVHNMGEVWAMALFEVRARFITRLGFEVGNRRMLQYVTDAMKLDMASPTMLQGRDSLLVAAAANSGTATADITDVWTGFATRGMGYSAQIINPGTGGNNTRVIEAFDVPWLAATTGTLTTESIPNGRIDLAETIGVSLCVVNNSINPTSPATGTLVTSGGVTNPSAAQSFGVVGAGATVCRPFSFVVNSTCGATLTASLQLQDASTAATINYPFQVGSFVPVFTENFDGLPAPALPAGWTTSTLTGTTNLWATATSSPDTAPNRAQTGDPLTTSDNVLVSPTIALSAGVNRVRFRNSFDLEDNFDGGVLELAIGAGAFQDVVTAGATVISGGYTDTLSSATTNPLTGRPAWTGDSSGLITTTIDLPASAGGQNVKLRWRMGSDNSVAGAVWAIDTLTIAQPACSSAPAPTAVDDVYAVSFDTPLAVAAPGVLGNDVGASTATLGTGPGHGTLSLSPSGAFSYTPASGYSGPDAFTYRANNSSGPSGLATVNLTVIANIAHPPTALYASSIVGNTITLKWTPPTVGKAPTDYVLEGGVAPGEVLATLPLGGTTPSLTIAAPSGAFFLRVHTLSGSEKSVASNEIHVFVSTPAPPSAPANLLGLVNTSTLTLGWRNTFEGGAPTSLLLDVTGTLSGTLPLALTDIVSFPSVPAGTYTFAVRAVNNAGASSQSSPVTLTFPSACSGVPQAPSSYLFFRIGNTLNLLWDPPLAGPAAEGYVLNVTGAFVGSVPVGTTRTLSAAVGPGTFNVSVHAINACGPGAATAIQTVVVP